MITAPPSEEYQVAEALGCRNNQSILLLRLGSDGRFRWPEGDVRPLEQTLALITAWCEANADGVIAVLAPRNAKLADAQPVLKAVRELGHTRLILATEDISPLARAARPRLTGTPR